jgi:His/Glu/Gln/Arg/opine family amino acid ABC transporter permease subunit
MSAQSPTIRRFNLKAVALILLRLLGVAFIVVLIPIAFNMEWRNFEKIFQKASSIRFITQGLIATITISLVAILASLPIATMLALGRLSAIRMIRWPCIVFIEVVRAVPLVLLIFYLNLRLPQLNLFTMTGIKDTTSFIGFTLEAILSPAAISVALALTIYTSAVNAELLRSGILSLERGQNEAARSLGLTYAQTMRRVILPQAFRRTLAPLIAQFTILVKDTSLGSIVGFFELQRSAGAIGNLYYNTLEALYVVAIIYFIINYLLGLTSRLVERRGPSIRVRPAEL